MKDLVVSVTVKIWNVTIAEISLKFGSSSNFCVLNPFSEYVNHRSCFYTFEYCFTARTRV